MKRIYIVGIAVVAWGMATSMKAMETPLLFGSSKGICNEFGSLLPGRNPSCVNWGLEYITGTVVQVIHALDGVAYPPNPDGTPSSTNNVIIKTMRIGEGINGALLISGQFGGSLDYFPRSSMTVSPLIFARVFNRASVDESSFYGDSQIYEVPVWGDDYGRFLAQIPCTGIPLSTNDADGDGLNASWEKSYGSSDGELDSDGDGLDDYLEHRLGLNPGDEASYLAIVHMQPAGSDDLQVSWPSATGISYQVQVSTDSLMAGTFADLYDPIPGAADSTSIVITNGLNIEGLKIRVRADLP